MPELDPIMEFLRLLAWLLKPPLSIAVGLFLLIAFIMISRLLRGFGDNKPLPYSSDSETYSGGSETNLTTDFSDIDGLTYADHSKKDGDEGRG